MSLNILFVEDNEKWRDQLVEYFKDEKIGEHSLQITIASTFDEGKKFLKEEPYDVVILDLYQGEPVEGNPKTGLEILTEIQKTVFVPVIFFTGLTKDIAEYASEVVGVVNKAKDGLGGLKSRLEEMVSSNLALIKRRIFDHIGESLRSYFWDTVHSQHKIFEHGKIDVSLGYLLLRRIANSLSKENIKTILSDNSIEIDKAHPMEFYIFPPENKEYEAGEILGKDGNTYVILTPSCDFVCEGSRDRKAGGVLLCSVTPLIEMPEYKKFQANNTKVENLQRLIESRRGDQYFFLPGTPFMENGVLDFQNIVRVDYSRLADFARIAKLDDPFAQAMATSFVRFYNRVGFPDIDSGHILKSL